MTQFVREWVQDILAKEKNDLRFEDFAGAFLNEFYGKQFFSTTRNYDLARDGRTAATPDGTDYYTATLSDNPNKPIKDVTKVSKKGTIRQLYLCFSKTYTEKKLTEIELTVRKATRVKSPITPLSGHQIAKSVSEGRGRDAFLMYYRADYEALKAAKEEQLEAAPEGLKLALGTILPEDAVSLRNNLAFKAIALSLDGGLTKTAKELQADIAKNFGLKHFSLPALEFYCRRAEEALLVSHNSGKWSLAAGGEALVAESKQLKLDDYIKGQTLVRSELENVLGQSLAEGQWKAIWSVLEAGLVELFYTRGMELSTAIQAFVDKKPMETDVQSSWDKLSELLTKAAATQSGPIRGNIEKALTIVFSPASVATTKWLTQLASAYIVLCTLGFENSVGSAVKEALEGVAFYFDTDIALTYLCEHEPMSGAARSVKQFTDGCGNRVHIPFPVVEECAMHAARSLRDHEEGIGPADPSLEPGEIDQIFTTVFSREFEHLRSEKRADSWREFIVAYSGSVTWSGGRSIPDVANMRGLLLQDKFVVLSLMGDDHRRIVEKLKARIASASPEKYSDHESLDKLRIDIELVVEIVIAAQTAHLKGVVSNILVTSSNKFRNLQAPIQRELKEFPQIMRLEEIMWMVSLMPNSPISLADMGTFLFEGRTHVATGGLERLIDRVLRRAKTAAMPSTQRSLLVHRLRAGMYEEAKKLGNPKMVIDEAKKNPTLFAKIAAAAFDADPESRRSPADSATLREGLDLLASEIKASRGNSPDRKAA